jgi:hypothetical protein
VTAVVSTWTPPPIWPVPREWPGATCLVVCSGESVNAQREQIARFSGRVIAVKHGVLLRPAADVFFMSGEWTADIAAELLPAWQGRGLPGRHAIVRGRSCEGLDPIFRRVTRSKHHETLSDRPDHVTGYDTGTSAINLAYHFGATTIVLAGYDMTGGHFCKHPLPFPPRDHFERHMKPLDGLNADARQKGIRIINVSPISAVTAFERGRLEDWL